MGDEMLIQPQGVMYDESRRRKPRSSSAEVKILLKLCCDYLDRSGVPICGWLLSAACLIVGDTSAHNSRRTYHSCTTEYILHS